MVLPIGIAPSFKRLSASVAICVIAVHIAVFVGVHLLGAAVLTKSAGSTFATGIECVIQPAGISPAFGDSAAFGTFRFITVHIFVFTGINLGVTMRACRRYRQRQDRHDHHDRQDQTQDFTEFLFQNGGLLSWSGEKENASSELRRSP